MSKNSLAITLAMVAGIAIGSIEAQAPGRGVPVGPASVSKRGNRQIGSSALNHLGLRVSFPANAFGSISFSEAAAKADALGTGFLEASSTQKVSPEIAKNLDYNLSPDEVAKVKHRLGELRLRILAYRTPAIPADAGSRRRLFEFANAVGIETIVTSAAPAALPELDELARELGVNVAFESSNPKTLMSSLEGQSRRIGLSADTAAWAQAGIKPADGLRLVNARLLSLGLTDAATGTEQVLLEWAKLNPLGAPPPITCATARLRELRSGPCLSRSPQARPQSKLFKKRIDPRKDIRSSKYPRRHRSAMGESDRRPRDPQTYPMGEFLRWTGG